LAQASETPLSAFSSPGMIAPTLRVSGRAFRNDLRGAVQPGHDEEPETLRNEGQNTWEKGRYIGALSLGSWPGVGWIEASYEPRYA
jgi:hypothetical protein